MKKSVKGVLVALAVIACAVLALKGSVLIVQSGSWSQTGNLSSARVGASAALLPDGRILVTGGDPGTGPVPSADFLNTDGTVFSAPPMKYPRSQHLSVALQDGRILVAGGLTAPGTATGTAEIFDPVAGSWSSVGSGMTEARSGATAAVLQDGRVLIAGGQNGTAISSTIEIFDPVHGTFTSAGIMSSPRTQHAMALLQSGQVLIVGGNSGNTGTPPAPTPVASTDIFDPVAGTVSAGPSLATPRYNHSATTLLNGQVVVIGGNNGNANPAQMDVTPAELVDFTAATPAFTTLATNLATPREGHLAILLPNNNNLLIAGGTSAGTTISSAELFTALETPQDVWTYAFGSTGSMITARSSAVGSANQVNAPSTTMQRNGVVMLAGGNDANGNALNTTEAYGFPTVQTDASDYPPFTTVTITGSGFQPGETITLTLVESPLIDTGSPFTTVADANGNFSDNSFATDSHDVSVRFYLTATGQTSGFQAENAFTDNADKTTTDVTCSPNPVEVNTATTCTATVTDGSPNKNPNPQGTVQFSFSGTGTAGTFVGNPCTLSASSTCLVSVTLTPAAAVSGTVTGAYSPSDATKWSSSNGTFALTVAGPANKLAFVQQPTNTEAGSSITPAVTVNVEDASGNVVTNSTASVALAIGTNSGGGTLSGTTTVNAVNGVATFSGLSINKTGNGYTLAANSTGLTAATSNTFNITSGTATQLVFGQQPTNAVAGSSITPAVTVQVEDANNNVVTTSAASVTVAIGSNPSSGTLSGTKTVNAVNGVATFNNLSINNTGSGYTLTASSAGLAGATSNTFSIGQASTTTALTSSANPSVFGQSVTFTATVTVNSPGTGTIPAGETVTFKDGGAAIGTGTTNASGVATFATSTLSVATHTITAVYTGDTNFATSTSTAVSQVVNQASTTTALTSSVNPSVFGQSVTFTATVTVNSPGAGTIPAGETVTFKDGTTAIGTGTTNASGVATFVTSTLSVATHTITAVYASDTNFAASTSTAVSQVVNKASTTTTITNDLSTATVVGQAYSVAVSVAITAPGAGTIPNGDTVTVSDGSASCTVTLSSAAGSCSLTSTTAGGKTITATYNGDASFNTSTSTGVAHTVNKASTTTTITSNTPNPSTVGQSVTINYSVTVNAPGAGTPTGNVTVSDTAGDTCTAAVAAQTCSITFNTAGTKTLTATYAGDTNFNTSASTGTSQTVNPKLAFTSTAFAILTGTCSSTISVQIENANGSAATLTTATVLSLSSSSGTGKFFSDSTCATQITTATIAAGSSTASFFYDDTTIGSPVITVASTGLTSVTQPEAITGLIFDSNAFSVPIGVCSSAITLQSANSANGGPTVLTLATTINLTSTSGGGKFYSNSTCTTQITTTSIGPGIDGGHDSNSFFYEDSVAGSPTLKGSAGTASATQTESVMTPPTISKAFSPASIPVNGTSTITFTLTNPAVNTTALTNVAFSDTFPTTPGALVVASPTGVADSCGGTVTAIAGAGSVSLSGGTIPAGTGGTPGTCAVSVNVTPPTAGTYNNTTGPISSANGGTGTTSNTATLTVTTRTTTTTIAPATTSASVGGTASFTITVKDTNAGTASNPVGSVSFNDTSSPANLDTFTTCTLTQGTNPVGTVSCTVTATATTPAGVHTINASFTATDGVHANSSTTAAAILNVTTRSTSTTVVLTPSSVTTGGSSTVAVTVADTAGTGSSTPAGTISFTSSDIGANGDTFSPTSCTLSSSGTCSVTVTTHEVGTGSHLITATYAPNDSVHATSNGSATLAVTGTAPSITSTASATFTAGTPVSFTVTTTGTPTPSLSDGSAMLPTGVTFTDNGNGTATLAGTTTVAGITQFTITASNGVQPNATQHFTLTILAAAPASISVFSGSPQSATVNTAFTNPLVALVQDSFGNPVPSVSVTYTAPTSGASGTFANSTNTDTEMTNAGGLATSSTFTANTTASPSASPYTVSASTPSVTGAATFSLTNNPASPTQLVITSKAFTIIAGQCSGNITVTSEDQYGNTSSVNNSVQVDLSSTSTITGKFYSDAACQTLIPVNNNKTSVTINSGSSSQTFSYTDTTPSPAASPMTNPPTFTTTITAADDATPGLTSGTQNETILMLAFTTPSFTTTQSTCSGPITLTAENASGTPTMVTVAATLGLTSSSSGATFYSDTACGTAITPSGTPLASDVSIASGASAVSFSYEDSVAGNPTITATIGAYSLTQQEEIGTPPKVTTNPSNATITYGSNATFTAVASGSPAPTVQWQVSSDGTNYTNVTNGGVYSVSTTSTASSTTTTLTLTVPPVSLSGTYYRAVFTNVVGTAPSNAATLTVNPEPLTVSIIGNPTKTYDGGTTATLTPANFYITGLVGTDKFTVTQTMGTYASANAGMNIGVTAYLSAINFTPYGSTMASNYSFPTSASGTGTINPKALTATIVNNPTKTYDGTTTATLTPYNFSIMGLVSPDSFTVNQTVGMYASANAGTGITVTASLTPANFVPVGSTLSTNYTYPNYASGTGTITQAASTTIVTCPASVTYSGAAQTPCSAIVTGVGGLSVNLTVSYTNNINAGTATASASYAGDANHTASMNSTTFVINPAATTTSVTSSLNPSTFGDSVTFTAVVTNASGTAVAPTGSVQFVIDTGAPIVGTPGACPATAPAYSFCATTSTSTLTVSGSPHTITANYMNADPNFSASSGSLTGGQTVNQATSATALMVSPGSVTLGDIVTLTATVTDASTNSMGTPTGLVVFLDGTTPIGTGTLSSGVGTFTTSLLAVGSHSITAAYQGDSNFKPSYSPTPASPNETVNLRPSSVGVTLTPATVVVGQSATITATITDNGTTNPPGAADTWVATAGTPATGTTGSTATLFADGMVLVAGGTNSSGTAVQSAYIYNATSRMFSATTGSLNYARTGATATLLPNGDVLIAGGSSDGTAANALNTAELYNPVTGTFTVAGAKSTPTANVMTAARFGATATLLGNGQVLLVGGESSGGSLASAELYNPMTDSFTATGTLATGRYGAAAVLLTSGKVLIVGGTAASGVLASAELFDPGAGTFSPAGTMNAARTGATATLLLNGNVLIAGGSSDGSTPLNSAEIYNTSGLNTGTFTSSNSMLNTARFNGTATLLPNGMVLLVGGASGSSAELYDADSDKFDTTGSLMQPDQASLTATLLNKDHVLVTGLTSGGTPVSDAELYTPSFNPLGTVGLMSSEGTDTFGAAPCVLTPSSATASMCTSSVTPSNVATSPHTITGAYPTDTFVHSGSSNFASLTVNKADSLTTVSSSPSSSVFGQPVTFSATVGVIPPGKGIPTGSVNLYDGGTCAAPGTTLATALSLSGAMATFTTSTLSAAASPHSILACYSGDPNFNATGTGASTATPLTQIVKPAPTSTTVNSSQNPSIFGQSVTFTATVTNTGSTATPTGIVQFYVDGSVFGSAVAVSGSGATVAATSGAIATLTVNGGTAHTVTANYVNSDGNFVNSTGSLTGGQTVKPAPTSTTVSSSQNPSIYGQPVTFTATVMNTAGAGVSTATPTGSVQFYIDGSAFGSPVAVSGSGATASTMSQATTKLMVSGSPHIVTASYLNSDGNFSSGTGSLTSGQTVSPAALTITASSGSMTYGSTSPVIVGPLYVGPGNFVNGEGPGVLSPQPTCGPVFTATTPAATYPYPTSCSGAGDPNYTISYVMGSVVVSQATTMTTVTSSTGGTSIFLQPVTFTATVADNSMGSTGTPTGSVSFYDAASGAACATLGSNTLIGTPQTLIGGSASVTTATLAGTTATSTTQDQHTILACYADNVDANFISSSGTTTQTVDAVPVITISPLSNSFTGQNVGSTSTPFSFTVTNVGDATLDISSATIIGDGTKTSAPSEFSIYTKGNPTPCGSTLAAMSSCTIQVTFTPQDTGEASAILQITDNNDQTTSAASQTQNITLTGGGLSTLMAGGSLYSYAIFATANSCGAITLSGGSTVDSFNSSMGPYSPSNDQLSGGNVGTNGNVTLNGSKTTIYGSAAVDSMTTGNCSKTSDPGLTTSGGAQVTGPPAGGLVALNGPITYPAPPAPNPAPPTTDQNISGSCPSGMTGCKNTGNKTVTLPPGSYGNVQLNGGTTANLATGTYDFNSLILSGNSVLYVSPGSGPIIINVAGNGLSGGNSALDLSGGSMVNASGKPSNLEFFYGGTHGVNLSGGLQAYATLYAPMAPVNMSGGTDFFGALIGSTVTDSGGTKIHYDTSLTDVASGQYLWFTIVVNNVQYKGSPLGSSAGQVKLYLTNSTISFAATNSQCSGSGGTWNSGTCTLPVPNAVVTLNSASKTSPTTSFDQTSNRWSTSVPPSDLTGNTFVTGLAVPVPAGFPAGIQNVNWSAAFSTDTPYITLQWQWSAGVYTALSTTYATTSPVNSNVLGVNAEDGSADTNGTDPAGTPETYKQDEVIGFFSASAGVTPAAAEMSTAPSDYFFVPETDTVPTASTLVAVLTNNDGVTHNISGLSVSGTNFGDFALQSGTQPADTAMVPNCFGLTALAAGASCNLHIIFKPTIVGAETAKIVINDDANNSPQTVYLSGTGTTP
jgi:hypothetical protein